jgi:hypothetical protein
MAASPNTPRREGGREESLSGGVVEWLGTGVTRQRLTGQKKIISGSNAKYRLDESTDRTAAARRWQTAIPLPV